LHFPYPYPTFNPRKLLTKWLLLRSPRKAPHSIFILTNLRQSGSLQRLVNLSSHLPPARSYSSHSAPFSQTFELNTGAKIPALGLGTWQSKPQEVEKAVEIALRKGYRHIDTALAYGNEAEVGRGIKNSGVPRSEIWLTTKLDNPWHKRVAEGIDSSLKSLGTDYVDLYLMHWPSSTDPNNLKKHLPDWNFIKTWQEMQKLPATGKVRNIGVSNFGIKNLEILLNDPSTKVCMDPPARFF
jgi:aryl-alcohol dehydrogenase-like predicted oxidoreductase